MGGSDLSALSPRECHCPPSSPRPALFLHNCRRPVDTTLLGGMDPFIRMRSPSDSSRMDDYRFLRVRILNRP